jgi:hypothetical protein
MRALPGYLGTNRGSHHVADGVPPTKVYTSSSGLSCHGDDRGGKGFHLAFS